MLQTSQNSGFIEKDKVIIDFQEFKDFITLTFSFDKNLAISIVILVEL